LQTPFFKLPRSMFTYPLVFIIPLNNCKLSHTCVAHIAPNHCVTYSMFDCWYNIIWIHLFFWLSPNELRTIRAKYVELTLIRE
jgi:hypothetical protein